MQVRLLHGGPSEIPHSHIFLCVRIYRAVVTAHLHHIMPMERWFRNRHTRSVFPGAPELPSLIPIFCCLSISGAPDTRVMTEFGIITVSSMLNNIQSIAQGNRSQLLDSPETDPVEYFANHPGIEWLSKRYPGDVSYPQIWLMYSRLTRRIQPNISLLTSAKCILVAGSHQKCLRGCGGLT
jgi:hypothetical protein